jgi:hypothetical protein
LQRSGDGLGDVVLNGEDVGKLAVVAFRPEMIAVLRVDELCGYADTVSGSPEAAFKNRPDAKRLGDPADVLFLAAEGEGGPSSA